MCFQILSCILLPVSFCLSPYTHVYPHTHPRHTHPTHTAATCCFGNQGKNAKGRRESEDRKKRGKRTECCGGKMTRKWGYMQPPEKWRKRRQSPGKRGRLRNGKETDVKWKECKAIFYCLKVIYLCRQSISHVLECKAPALWVCLCVCQQLCVIVCQRVWWGCVAFPPGRRAGGREAELNWTNKNQYVVKGLVCSSLNERCIILH